MYTWFLIEVFILLWNLAVQPSYSLRLLSRFLPVCDSSPQRVLVHRLHPQDLDECKSSWCPLFQNVPSGTTASLRIHAWSCHIATVGVSTDMRSDVRHLYLIDFIVTVNHVVETVLPMNDHQRKVFLSRYDWILSRSKSWIRWTVSYLDTCHAIIVGHLWGLNSSKIIKKSDLTGKKTRSKFVLNDPPKRCISAVIVKRDIYKNQQRGCSLLSEK